MSRPQPDAIDRDKVSVMDAEAMTVWQSVLVRVAKDGFGDV